MLDKLLRFGHSANYDVQGVGRALKFSIPVWVLGAKQTLDFKSISYKPGSLGFINIEAEIKDLPEPQHCLGEDTMPEGIGSKPKLRLGEDHTRDTRITLKHRIVE